VTNRPTPSPLVQSLAGAAAALLITAAIVALKVAGVQFTFYHWAATFLLIWIGVFITLRSGWRISLVTFGVTLFACFLAIKRTLNF
jgi:hypothetical protein